MFPDIWWYLVAKSSPALCDPMDCSTPGFPVLHHLLEFTHIHVYRVSDATPPSHPLSSPSPPAFNLSQHHGLFQWVGFLHQVAKVLELQFQHQSFQWIFRVDFLQDGLVWPPCCPRDSQESSSAPQFGSINSSLFSHLYGSTLTPMHDHWETVALTHTPLSAAWRLCFITYCPLGTVALTHTPLSAAWRLCIFTAVHWEPWLWLTRLCQRRDVSAFSHAVQVCRLFSSNEQASFHFMAAVTVCSISESRKRKSGNTVSIFHPSICHEVVGLDLCVLNVEF